VSRPSRDASGTSSSLPLIHRLREVFATEIKEKILLASAEDGKMFYDRIAILMDSMALEELGNYSCHTSLRRHKLSIYHSYTFTDADLPARDRGGGQGRWEEFIETIMRLSSPCQDGAASILHSLQGDLRKSNRRTFLLHEFALLATKEKRAEASNKNVAKERRWMQQVPEKLAPCSFIDFFRFYLLIMMRYCALMCA
jgi:hypothetical protein